MTKVKLNLTSMVLDYYSKGLYAKQIADKLNISKARVSQITKKLEDAGFLHLKLRGSFKYYELTEKGKTAIKKNEVKFSSLGGRTKLHALQGKLPIIEDNSHLPEAFWDKANNELNNWTPLYKRFDVPIGFTVTKTPKAIVFHLYAREIDEPKEAQSMAWKCALYLSQYFKAKGLILDIWNAKISNEHYSVPDEVAKRYTEQGHYVEVHLGRKAKPLLPLDNIDAKAWIDASEGRPEIESNDVEYITRYIKMPDTMNDVQKAIHDMADNQRIYAEHLNAHIPVLKGLSKIIKKMDRRLSQKTLGEFR